MKQKGIFISIEGPEGCGKTTQIRELAKYLSESGKRVKVTREPGGTSFTAKIRRVLLGDSKEDVSALSELFLYLSDRAQHVKNFIIPALKKGMVIITDRFSDSTYAYQGYGRGISMSLIKKLDKIATQGFKPDLTIIIDAEVKNGLRRAGKVKGRNDRLEKAGVKFHRKVRKGYLALAKKSPERIKLVKRQPTVGKTQKIIRNLVRKCLLKKS